MKKIFVLGVLALAAAALSTQQASAWINSKFNASLNYQFQSGGNNLLWGAFRNGQPPAADGCTAPGNPIPTPHGSYFQPNMQDHGVNAGVQTVPAPTATIPAQTQSYGQNYYGQTVNYQYPYAYPYYYNYGYNGYYR